MSEWDILMGEGKGGESECDGNDDDCNGIVDEGCEFDSCILHSGGSTVNMATGNLQHSQVLFTVPDAILPIDFTLTYNSLDNDGPLGYGWTHTYNIQLILDDSGGYTLSSGYGKDIVLIADGDHYSPENSTYPELVVNADGTFTLTHRDSTVYLFNNEKQLTEIQDRKGNAITLVYTDGNLTQLTDPSNRVTTLTYDSYDKINTIADPNNNIHNFTYQVLDNIFYLMNVSTQSVDAGTLNWSYTYSTADYTLNSPDNYPNSKRPILFRTKTDPVGYVTTYQPDPYFRAYQTTDPEGKSRYVTYDPNMYLDPPQPKYTTMIEERDGGIWTYLFYAANGKLLEKTDPEGNITKYTYYPDGNVETIVYPEDPESGFIYPDDYTTTYTYDANGNIWTIAEPSGHVTTYTWTSDNEIDTVTDSDGNVWDYDYYENGDLMSITEPSELNPSGVTTTYTYDYYADGNIQNKYVTNPANQTTTFAHNTLNQLISLTDHTGETISFTYYSSGNVETITDPRNNVWTFEFNSINQLTKITDPKTNVTIFSYDYNGNLTSVVDANGNTTFYDYNYDRSITEIQDPLNNISSFVYGGTGCASCGDGGDNLVSFTNANGKVTSFTNYLTGKRASQTDPLGNTITFAYNPRGLIKSITDPATSTTQFGYNKRGLVSTITDALDSVTSFTYNGTKKVGTRTDRNSDRTIYTYTPDGKLDTITYQDTSSVNFDYDSIDRPVLMRDLLGDTTYVYNDQNRTITVTDPHGFVVTYKYDAAGNLIELTYPNNKTVTYEYDELNRLWKVHNWLNQTATYTYDPGGSLASLENFNGTITDYGYDNANRLTSFSHTRTNATVIASYSFILDGVGNRTQIVREEPLAMSIAAETTDYTYNTEKNRLLTAGAANFSYDNEGQIQSRDSDTFTFDYEHRLSGMTGLVDATFSYDGRWSRLKAERNGVITYYIYDINGTLLAEADASRTITKYYIHGSGLVAMVTSVDEVYTYHFNSIGSTVAMTDVNENIVNSYAYTPFGIIANETETVEQAFKYVGEYGVMHEPNGLYYMWARYYDPYIGRFVSEDPIGFAGGDVNMYAYVWNDPVSYIDPLGLYGKEVHYYLTLDEALKAGIEFRIAVKIASTNQRMDENFLTNPLLPWNWLFGTSFHFQSGQYAMVGLEQSLFRCNIEQFGNFLHILQDSFSHAGYGFPLGHATEGTAPDRYCEDSERDTKMRNATFFWLNEFENRCGHKYHPIIRRNK